MTYRRRYFEPFVGTTETIGDVSITSDKIAPKAVTTPKVADDAITSEQIADETIRSEDIGPSQVKTSDLAPGAVTTSKISDGAVTTPKIAGTVALRPLTPAASTSEIADAAVTLVKLAADSVDATKIKPGAVGESELAGDAVVTVKIKDAAVTGTKIDTDTITQANIAADAVGGPEIKDGAIETEQLSADAVQTVDIKDDAVTNPKLAGDAVGTGEIVDGAVTVPKLEDDFLAKYYLDRQVFYDDFLGAVLDNRWAESGDPGGSVVVHPKSAIYITANKAVNEFYRINWNGKQGLFVGKLPKFYAVVTLGDLADFEVNVGLRKDANNLIWFSVAFGANWFATCMVGGVPTSIDTGVPFGVVPVELYIDVVSVGEVKFYIDGVLKATINTNIPAAVNVEPWLEIEDLAAGVDPSILVVDKVIITANPE